MTDRDRYRPFTNDPTSRVRFDAAPLEFVICQIRWPRLASLQGDISPVAKHFGSLLIDFPLYTESPEISVQLTPSGVQQSQTGVVYQWSSADRSIGVSFTRDFIAVTSKRYSDYDSFSATLRGVLNALRDSIDIPLVERIGVRYLNRITDATHLTDIARFVRPEMLGHQALTSDSSEVHLVQALSHSLFRVGTGQLQARSGVLPPGETLDPTVEPVNALSWVLDIDSFSQRELVFSVDAVLTEASRLSDAAYDFFKHVIKTGFFEAFDGRTV